MPRPKSGYRLKNGTKATGVTTITGRYKDASGLLWWAFDQGKAAERGEINSLYDKRDEAGDAGTLAHALVEARIHGSEPPVVDLANPAHVQASTGFQNYLEWHQNNRIVIVEQELELVSETYRFGGSPDAIGVDNQDRFCLLDWKTSKAVYPEYLVQLAAYKALIEEATDYRITGGFHLLRFSKENADFSHHYWTELDDAWELFLLYKQAYELDKKLKKRTG